MRPGRTTGGTRPCAKCRPGAALRALIVRALEGVEPRGEARECADMFTRTGVSSTPVRPMAVGSAPPITERTVGETQQRLSKYWNGPGKKPGCGGARAPWALAALTMLAACVATPTGNRPRTKSVPSVATESTEAMKRVATDETTNRGDSTTSLSVGSSTNSSTSVPSAAEISLVMHLAGGGLSDQVLFDPAGKRVAIGTRPIQIFEIDHPDKIQTLVGPDPVTEMAFSPDGRYLIAGSQHGGLNHPTGVFLFDAATGVLLERLADGTRYVDSVAFSPDGTLIAGASADGVTVWSTNNRRQAAHLISRARDTNNGTREVRFSFDGEWIAFLIDRHVEVWNTRSWTFHTILGVPKDPGGEDPAPVATTDDHCDDKFNFVWAHKSNVIATSGGSAAACVYNAGDGSLINAIGRDPVSSVVGPVSWSPADDAVLIPQTGGAGVYDVQSAARIALLAPWGGDSAYAAWSPDGRYVATGGRGWIRSLNSTKGQPGTIVDRVSNDKPTVLPLVETVAFGFSPDSSMVAFEGSYGEIDVWRLPTSARPSPRGVTPATTSKPRGPAPATSGPPTAVPVTTVFSATSAAVKSGLRADGCAYLNAASIGSIVGEHIDQPTLIGVACQYPWANDGAISITPLEGRAYDAKLALLRSAPTTVDGTFSVSEILIDGHRTIQRDISAGGQSELMVEVPGGLLDVAATKSGTPSSQLATVALAVAQVAVSD